MTKIIDISPPLSATTAVWPGDVPLSRSVQLSLEKGDNIELSSLNTTVHVGAHADAPSHYEKGAPTISEVDLEAYIGPCHVVHWIGASAVLPEAVAAAVESGAERILVRTIDEPQQYDKFPDPFSYFAPETMELLGSKGVKLIGIDTPSVDHFESKSLDAHHILLKYGIRNLEGLELNGVDAGEYELIALPLKLVGFDASPVRAILRKQP